ncbi:hypothetical protein AMJ40_05750 [candidate division TA06 bacterium DG_26]|uniref:Uncharacterized protein n=1 Tax=candidate division TA06 bacterium DG_26 TaxID=1703771 RepID=A0A0S7WGU4_UNCT6|nr:MAG: hypothetical protein AMJ40_05750 [candidate division TA06 bacterium DG_26]
MDDAITGIEQAYRQLGREAEAIGFLESLRPTAAILMRKGDAYLNLKRYRDAIGEYMRVVDSFAKSSLAPAALYKAAETYVKLNEYSTALSHCERLIKTYPSSEWVDESKLKIGEIHVRMGDYRGAIEHLGKYRSDSRLNESLALLYLGTAYAQSGETYRAKETLLSIEEKYPEEPTRDRANLELGKIYLDEGGYSVALSRFRDVIRNRSDDIACEAQYWIGEVYLEQNEFEKALAEYERVEYVYAFCTEWVPKALLGAGACYEKLERYDQARETYKKIIDKYSNSPEATEAQRRLEKAKWK